VLFRSIVASAVVLAAVVGLGASAGREFLPELDEGSLWLQVDMPSGISLDKANEMASEVRRAMLEFPEVKHVVTQLGRNDSGTDPWTLAGINQLDGTWDALPGDVLYTTGGESETTASGLPAVFLEATASPLPVKQGATTIIRVQVPDGVTVSGLLVDHALHFFQDTDGSQVALQGVHALLDPGPYPLRLEAALPDGSRQSFEQMVLVTSGNYQREDLYVESSTIDPAVTEPEVNE